MSIVSTSVKGLVIVALIAAGLSWRAMTPAGPAAVTILPAVDTVGSMAESNVSPDGIPLTNPHAAATTQSSAPDAWSGPRTGNESTLSDRVVNYDIAATLDPVKHIVDGQEKLTWRNRSNREVCSVYLHLYLNAFESNNSTFYSEKRTKGFEFRGNVRTNNGEWGHTELNKIVQNGTTRSEQPARSKAHRLLMAISSRITSCKAMYMTLPGLPTTALRRR